MNIQELKQRFHHSDNVSFTEIHPGFPLINIQNSSCKAVISVYGGHLLSYEHKDYGELFYLSRLAQYEKGKSIRGGVPVCWPAFGASNPEIPFHGFARNQFWQIESIEELDERSTAVKLRLESSTETLSIWPFDFKLVLNMVLGDTVKLELVTENTGSQAFDITQALHSYFKVEDISDAAVTGLEGLEYLDTTIPDKEKQRMRQDAAISFNSEVDSVYMKTIRDVTVQTSKDKSFRISAGGSETTVVWNPWSDICKSKQDLGDDDYRYFVCVETANALDDSRRVEPGENVAISAEYLMA